MTIDNEEAMCYKAIIVMEVCCSAGCLSSTSPAPGPGRAGSPLGLGAACASGGECASGCCNGAPGARVGVCDIDHCCNIAKGRNEADIDCGDTCYRDCIAGQTCSAGTDCGSGVCGSDDYCD